VSVHGRLSAVNNNTQTKARATARHSGKARTRTAGVLRHGKTVKNGKTVKIDWAFRRLRNQAVRFFAGGDRTLRRALGSTLEKARTYSDVEHEIMNELGPRKGNRTWHQFMDTFFGHRINKTARR
jgi:hypothetical protein